MAVIAPANYWASLQHRAFNLSWMIRRMSAGERRANVPKHVGCYHGAGGLCYSWLRFSCKDVLYSVLGAYVECVTPYAPSNPGTHCHFFRVGLGPGPVDVKECSCVGRPKAHNWSGPLVQKKNTTSLCLSPLSRKTHSSCFLFFSRTQARPQGPLYTPSNRRRLPSNRPAASTSSFVWEPPRRYLSNTFSGNPFWKLKKK